MRAAAGGARAALGRSRADASALGSGHRAAVTELKRLAGPRWKELDSALQASFATTLLAQRIDREQATAFFAEGWRQVYGTKGHPKAKGLDCSLSVPASWSRREGERPNIVQVFDSGSENGRAMCSILIKDLPVPEGESLTQDDAREILSVEGLKDLVPEGGRLVESRQMTLDGSPAGLVVMDRRMQRLDQEVVMRMASFVTIQGRAMVFVQCAVAVPPENEASLEAIYNTYEPVFRSIASSLVLNDKYR